MIELLQSVSRGGAVETKDSSISPSVQTPIITGWSLDRQFRSGNLHVDPARLWTASNGDSSIF